MMKIGAHESVSGGVAKGIERAVADGCEAVQVFVKSSNRWEGKPLTDAEVAQFRKLAEPFGFENLCAHASYLINLAAAEGDTYTKSLISMTDELLRCDRLGIPFYVIHPGSHLGAGEDAGIARVAQSIDTVYQEHNNSCMLLLEVTAGQGSNLGWQFSHISRIIEASAHHEKLGICLDSCHLFSAGYDLLSQYDAVISEVVSRFGDKLKVFHVNDTKKALGSRVDRHEMIGQGLLGEDFFRTLVNDSRLSGVLGILETPIADDATYAAEVALLKSYRR